jgi:hypothetical protein
MSEFDDIRRRLQDLSVSISSYICDGEKHVRINNWNASTMNCLDLSWDQYQHLLAIFDVLDEDA